jgi:hypothetical protein
MLKKLLRIAIGIFGSFSFLVLFACFALFTYGQNLFKEGHATFTEYLWMNAGAWSIAALVVVMEIVRAVVIWDARRKRHAAEG